MKKMIAMILALVMMLSLAACGGNAAAPTTAATEAPVEGPASALELLETVWALYGEDEMFPIIGGSMNAPVDGAPGNFDLADENITYNLLIPAEQLANVSEAASMIHMMNANTFTCAAYKLGDVSAADFGAAMKDAIMSNQWMCGFPDSLLISAIGNEYVVVAFGVNDAMNPFTAHLTAAYTGAQTLVSEPII